MNLEKFTDRAKGFIQSAQTVAIRMNHQRITPEHLAKALLEDSEGMAAGLITRASGNPAIAVQGIDAALGNYFRVGNLTALLLTPPALAGIVVFIRSIPSFIDGSMFKAPYVIDGPAAREIPTFDIEKSSTPSTPGTSTPAIATKKQSVMDQIITDRPL